MGRLSSFDRAIPLSTVAGIVSVVNDAQLCKDERLRATAQGRWTRMGFYSPQLPPRSEVSDRIPTPLAIAGIGMLLGAIMPDRITVGQGFWYGLLVGFAVVAVVALLRDSQSDNPSTKHTSQPEARSNKNFEPEQVLSAPAPAPSFDPEREYAPTPETGFDPEREYAPEPAPSPRRKTGRRKSRENHLKGH